MDDEDPGPTDSAIADRITFLASEARTQDVARRRLAVRQIYDICFEMGTRAQAAVPVLVDYLSDPDEEVGDSSQWGLKYCVPESITALISCLGNPNAIVRRRACRALGQIGDAAILAGGTLRELLADPLQDVRLSSAWALGQIGDISPKTMAALFRMSRTGGAAERGVALHALGNIGKRLVDPEPLRANQKTIFRALEDEDDGVRWSACYVLESLGLETSRRVGLLMRRLEVDPSARVRLLAADSLHELAPRVDLTEYVPILCERVKAAREEAARVCYVLASIGPKAKNAVPCLTEALRTERLVIAAAKALWQIDRRVDDSLPALAGVFESDGEGVCDAICAMGPAASPLINLVIKALERDDYWDLQWAAADALGAIASGDPEVLDVLTNSLGHTSPIVRRAAVGALAKIGAPAVPALMRIVDNIDDNRSEYAAKALGKMGYLAEAAAETLRAKMSSPNVDLASWCTIALAKVKGDLTAAPLLIGVLARNGQSDLRKEAVIALGELGPSAASALEAIRSALNDPDADVRTAAQEALTAIDAKPH
jgi:HEAT repeat protein